MSAEGKVIITQKDACSAISDCHYNALSIKLFVLYQQLQTVK